MTLTNATALGKLQKTEFDCENQSTLQSAGGAWHKNIKDMVQENHMTPNSGQA